MDKALKTKITYEISQIDELIDKAGVLVSLCKNKEPDFWKNARQSLLNYCEEK